MPQKYRSISDIQELVKKDRRMYKLAVLSIATFLIAFFLLISSQLKPYEDLLVNIFAASVLIALLISIFAPSISSLERTRYYLDDTTIHIHNHETKKASASFNEMMSNFDDLTKEFNGLPYAILIQERLLKIFSVLKQRVYPALEEGEKRKLPGMEKDLQDLAVLLIKDDISELDKYIGRVTQHFEKADRVVVLPYETPILPSRLFNIIQERLVSTFKRSQPFRFLAWFVVLFFIYSICIWIVNLIFGLSLEFNQAVVAALLIVAIGATNWKSSET